MGALADGGGAQADLLRGTAPRMLRLTLRLWARGVGAAPLLVYSPSALEPTGAAGIRALTAGTPGSCGAGHAAADDEGRCARPPILPAALTPGTEEPAYRGMAPSAAAINDTALLGAPPHPTAAGPAQEGPPPPRQLRALLWNTDAAAARPGLRFGGALDPKPPVLRPEAVTAPDGEWWAAVSTVLRAAAAAR
jgi:hypothetical protein